MRDIRSIYCLFFLCLLSKSSFGQPESSPEKLEGIPFPIVTGNEASSKSATLQALYRQLAQAPDEISAEKIVVTIENIWSHSGSPTADILLGRALEAAEAQNFDSAFQFLSRIVELYPNWPEAYNRRAYLYFLRQDYLQAQSDLRMVLSLDPDNFRAMEGLVRVLRALGQTKSALEVNRELLKVNPFSPGAKESLIRLEEEVKNQGL